RPAHRLKFTEPPACHSAEGPGEKRAAAQARSNACSAPRAGWSGSRRARAAAAPAPRRAQRAAHN
ncbi:hypothetical protein, partial [Actinotignum timonense]|uniref:hypothetical protein n=1 Tax=Actinotignum timonense TaxID=1870995 RepID=UPI002550F431